MAPFAPTAHTLSEPLPQTAAYEAFAGIGVLDRAAAVLPLLLGSGATLRQPVDAAIAIDNTNVTTGVPVRGDTLEEITRGNVRDGAPADPGRSRRVDRSVWLEFEGRGGSAADGRVFLRFPRCVTSRPHALFDFLDSRRLDVHVRAPRRGRRHSACGCDRARGGAQGGGRGAQGRED